MITIYADVLFAVNFAMLSFVLIIMRMFLRKKKSFLLCFAAAAAGSLGYILISFWDKAFFLRNIAGYSLLILLCACIAYIPESFKAALRLWGLLYIFTFAVGGICSGIFYYSNAGGYISENLSFGFKSIGLKLFSASVLFSYFIIKAGLKIYENRVIKGRVFYSVVLSLNGRKAEFKALGDTGNSLKDKISGKTVLVAEYEAVKGLLPRAELLKEDLAGYISGFGESIKFSLVPYKSLGNSDGLLFCFQADAVFIDGKPCDNIIIGISFSKLSSDGSFKGLINTEALISGEVDKNAFNAA
ncbi:MAG: sigma-E processing peptidase SpoIIGA [Clostridiales bacterium]|nr:sigma-E processing peptidase SpoIIGA [Clostridiales bacterium]